MSHSFKLFLKCDLLAQTNSVILMHLDNMFLVPVVIITNSCLMMLEGMSFYLINWGQQQI